MRKKTFLSFCTCLLLFAGKSFSQSPVNVNTLTGTANIVIPIYTVTNGQVSLPVGLSYSATGAKPKDVENTAGMGWQIICGGQVSRQVRGLPDDCTKDNSGATMLGWMSAGNTGASYASSFTILNNGASCSNGTNDITNINTNIPYSYDTEPDIFYVSAPGLSCEMVYDRADAKFHPVNYQDLIITYTVAGGTGNNTGDITSFTITNNKGTKYAFAAPESVTQTTVLGSGTANYFTTKYKQYLHGVTYSDSWNLTGITDANGNGVALNYGIAPVRNSTDQVLLFQPVSATQTLQYSVQLAVSPLILTFINTVNVNYPSILSNTGLSFNWITALTGQTVISSINGMGETFQFGYEPASASATSYPRDFLTSFTEVGSGTPINYQFGYIGVSANPNRTTLPDSTSNLIDYWGYYSSSATSNSLLPVVYVNPSSTSYPRYEIAASATPGPAYTTTVGFGNTRMTNAADIVNGSLNTITNANGGTTTLTYEPNDYYDVSTSSTVKGGGIRIKQIVDNPGIGSSITRNYTYLNSTGSSSGEPVTLPQFAFTVPYSGTATGLTLWTDATVLSANDLSTEDHTILYSSVKVSQTGAGSTVYNYNIPATYWNTSADPICTGCTIAEWHPTVNNVASYSCTASNGPIANLTYSYPFIPNPNYDFERGLPISVINYNDAGTKVSETDYTYQRSFTPTVINAFKSEDIPSTAAVAKFYNNYTIFYNTSELTATVIKNVFDSNTLSQAQTSTVAYTYGSTYHKLLTKQLATNSDNSTISTYYSYVKDYAPNSGATNVNINALYNLKLLNINAPVESYQQVTKGTTVTTGAALTLYSPSINGAITNYLPSVQKKMVQPDGGSFTPFSINTTAQTISSDPKYFTVANYNKYDNTGYLQTVDDNNKHFQTSFFDEASNHVTVAFKNASYNEVAFNDFDSKYAPQVNTFTISGTTSYNYSGSHTGNALNVAANTQTVTSSLITKNVTAQNYIFSVWINASAAGSLTFSGVTTPSLGYATGGWTYYEKKISATALASTFTLSFTSNQNIVIDDVLLYPDVAEAATFAYDSYNHKIAETNTNGVSAYYTNDQWGRILLKYDQDRNIVERKTYINAPEVANGLTIALNSIPAPVITNSPVTFNLQSNSGITGVLYTWDFGDGNTTSAVDVLTQTHTYTTPNTYTVTVTAKYPYNIGTQSCSMQVLMPLVAKICPYGVTEYNSCSYKAINISTCGTNSGDAIHSYYTVSSIINGDTNLVDYNYQWQQSFDNGNTWVNTGTNSPTYSSGILKGGAGVPAILPYLMRCVLNALTGTKSATSNSVQFIVDTNCSN